VLYLDANVFVFAAVNTEDLGVNARSVIRKIQFGEDTAVTSALTWDEVFWAVKKHSLELAFEVCEAMLNLPNLEIVSADKELALSALRLMRDCHLAPRDALHAATAIACGVDFLVTSDAHFSRVKELKIKDLE
jgi:Predicted nucleic acid-binding protein, contains PIN domain